MTPFHSSVCNFLYHDDFKTVSGHPLLSVSSAYSLSSQIKGTECFRLQIRHVRDPLGSGQPPGSPQSVWGPVWGTPSSQRCLKGSQARFCPNEAIALMVATMSISKSGFQANMVGALTCNIIKRPCLWVVSFLATIIHSPRN